MNAINKPNVWSSATLTTIVVLSAIIGFAVAHILNQTFNKEELSSYQKATLALPFALLVWKYKSSNTLRKISTRDSLSYDEKSRFNIFMHEKIKVYTWVNYTTFFSAALAFICIILIDHGLTRLTISLYITIYTFSASFMYILEEKYFNEFETSLDKRDYKRKERKKYMDALAKKTTKTS